MISRRVLPSCAAFVVRLGARVVAQPGEDDAVQGGVGLAVAAVVEPTRAPPAGGVLDGADSAKGSKGRLGVQSLGVVSQGDQESDGAVRTDAHRHEQLGGVAFDEPGQALVQLIDLPGELLNALGEHTQRHVGGLGHRILVSPTVGWTEARAGAEQLGIAQARQPFPQCGVGDDQDGLELVDRLGTGLDRGVLGELEDPGAVHRSIAGLGPGPGATAEHGPRGGLCVDRVRLPHQTAGRAVGPVHFIYLDLLRQQVAGQTRAEGAGALHPGTAHRTPLAGPDKQLSVACRRRGKGLCSQDLPQRGDHGGDMHLAVRVHTQYGLATSGRIRARGGTALSGRHGGPPPAW